MSAELIDALRARMCGKSQKHFALEMEISPAFFSDLLKRRRHWTPSLIGKFVEASGASAALSKKLHKLGAQAMGWQV